MSVATLTACQFHCFIILPTHLAATIQFKGCLRNISEEPDGLRRALDPESSYSRPGTRVITPESVVGLLLCPVMPSPT